MSGHSRLHASMQLVSFVPLALRYVVIQDSTFLPETDFPTGQDFTYNVIIY